MEVKSPVDNQNVPTNSEDNKIETNPAQDLKKEDKPDPRLEIEPVVIVEEPETALFQQRVLDSVMPFIFVSWLFCFVPINGDFGRLQRASCSIVVKVIEQLLAISHDKLPLQVATVLVLVSKCIMFIFAVVYWIIKLVVNAHIASGEIFDFILILVMIFGLISQYSICAHRQIISEALASLDYNPLKQMPRYNTLFTNVVSNLFSKRFLFLRILSYLIIVSIGLAFIALSLYSSAPYLVVWKLFNFMLSFFYIIADAALLIAFIWTIKTKARHCNLFVQHLFDFEQKPDVKDVELVRLW